MDLEGRGSGDDLGGVEGEKTTIGIYSMRKKSILNKSEKTNKQAKPTNQPNKQKQNNNNKNKNKKQTKLNQNKKLQSKGREIMSSYMRLLEETLSFISLSLQSE